MDQVPVFKVDEADCDIAITNRVELVGLVFLAFLVKLGEEFSEHEDDLLWLDGCGVAGES